MDDLLSALYNKFYKPLKDEERSEEISRCHEQLIQVLKKPERRLVLRIIDNKDYIAGELAYDAFVAGFHLAWKLSAEIRCYELGKADDLKNV